ncbi:MAG TPA: malectin domain-containing carbohydrate-binding protein [Bryobacteraceae bacterium]|nr:malectin domain-containing carbohydrate-binding protein [Bryobacteraceae bacterium]
MGPSDQFVEERKALRAALESAAFQSSANSARLLSFLCQKYFTGPGSEPTEYEIAVGALGRRTDFDPRNDSVVRVEVHRLRRRLQQFYTGEGASQPIQIVVPPGTYAPRFRNAGGPAAEKPVPPKGVTALPRRWVWLGLTAAVLLVSAVWLASAARRKTAASAPPAILPQAGQSEVRLMAGFPDGKYMDQSSHLWAGDAYFASGAAIEVRYGRLARTADPALYQHARQGTDFGYDIPLKPGVYEMRLHFAESSMRVPIVGETGEPMRRFRVFANGQQVLPPPDGRHVRQFYISSDDGGEDVADVKVFKDITPAPDGKLHLRFIADRQDALVNAIEIVPGDRGRLHPIRLCAAGRPTLDDRGNVWLPDNLAQGGRLSTFTRPIAGTGAPALFQGERFGHFSYTIPVAPSRYTVSLGFAENYYTVWNAAPGTGQRLFNVYLNGLLVLRDFDVFSRAGGALRAITRTFRDIEPTPQDKIVVTFEPVTDPAIVNTVEVIDQGSSL